MSGTATTASPASTLPIPSSAWNNPVSPGSPALVASTEVPACTEPKIVPTDNWTAASSSSEGVNSRLVTCVRVGGRPTRSAVGWTANQVPNAASNTPAATRAAPGFSSAATTPTRAGPRTNEASSAAPS